MKIVTALIFIFLSAVFVSAQTECPPSMICLTQEQANIAAQNARELAAQREKVTVLEESLKSKEETIAELKKVNEQNVNDFKERINQVTAELAMTKGQLVGSENMNVRQTAIIEALVKVVRPKKFGIIVF